MNLLQLVDKKRQGQSHSEAEIRALVSGYLSGELADYQMSAWLMAVCIHGLSLDETTWLTDVYVQSGKVLDFSVLGQPVVDKHSTGGVGDKVTLILVPLLAAAGIPIAKLSGRGLGFTGGTIDKLEAIPGFQVSLSADAFIEQVRRIGAAISSQTEDLAPADGKIYALRDVTATVASIPLIAASVVSKKIAAGADVIVLDIKVGRGAFMKTLPEAKQLAETCRLVGKRLGRHFSTLISAMDQPLGEMIGNSLEVYEAAETLQSRGPADLTELCLILGAMSWVGVQKAAGTEPVLSLTEAKAHLAARLADGTAFAKFQELIAAQGGDPQAVSDYTRLPRASRQMVLPAPCNGFISAIDALAVAEVAKGLGAGRAHKGDQIDLAVGVQLHHHVGDPVALGEPLLTLHLNQKEPEDIERLIPTIFQFSEQPVTPLPLFDELIE